jgi:hypothetical protein
MSYTIPDRAQINRNDSRHSTGPRIPEVRHRSCLSAFRHGLTGQMVLMPAEDLEAYQHHIQRFVNEYQPQGATESQLVQALADAAWRLNRVSVLETNLLTYDIVYEDFPNNESTHEMREAMAISAALDSHTRALSNLSLHGQRLSRQFEKTLALLQKLQSTRQANQPGELKHPQPDCDGFVFSDEEKSQPAAARRAAPVTAGNSTLISHGFAETGDGHFSEAA